MVHMHMLPPAFVQMPFHMHVNLELVEAVCLVSAMLLEVPHVAAAVARGGPGAQAAARRPAFKAFHRILDMHGRMTFEGPPESVRDHIVAASRALLRGDWRKAAGYVAALPVWSFLPGREQLLASLRAKLQAEALRAYLFGYGRQYDSLSLDQLCSMFELPEKKVYRCSQQGGAQGVILSCRDFAG
jgi:hypothetical protein